MMKMLSSLKLSVCVPALMTLTLGFVVSGGAEPGTIRTIVGVNDPACVFVDEVGVVYVSDRENYLVRKLDVSGSGAWAPMTNYELLKYGQRRIGEYPPYDELPPEEQPAMDDPGPLRTVAGNGLKDLKHRGYHIGDGRDAKLAYLFYPAGIFIDRVRNVYIADSGWNLIRKVDSTGMIYTIAGWWNPFSYSGLWAAGYSGDGGPALEAAMAGPTGIFVAASGDIYIADRENHRVRKVDTSGVIHTIAGNGNGGFSGDGGQAASASLYYPYAVFLDGAGNMYIADTGNNRIRRVDISGTITTVGGDGNEGFSGDGGKAISASLCLPLGIFVDSSGDLFIADTGNHRIRRVDSSGIITTVAGNGAMDYSGDKGPASAASLSRPSSIFVDSKGDLYVADTGNDRIRMVEGIAAPTILGRAAIRLSASTLDFRATRAGKSDQATLTIADIGNVPLSIKGITLGGADGEQFSITPNTATISSGQSLAFTVTFSPTSAGPKSATLFVNHNAGGASQVVLSGSAFAEAVSGRSPDFDDNGNADLEDFFLLAAAFGQEATGENSRFDLDGSGKIDLDDYFIFASAFGKPEE